MPQFMEMLIVILVCAFTATFGLKIIRSPGKIAQFLDNTRTGLKPSFSRIPLRPDAWFLLFGPIPKSSIKNIHFAVWPDLPNQHRVKLEPPPPLRLRLISLVSILAMLFSYISPVVQPVFAATPPQSPDTSVPQSNPIPAPIASTPALPSRQTDLSSLAEPVLLPTNAQDKPSTTTDMWGHYEFRGVAHGSHQVWIETDSLPAPWQIQAEAQPVKLLVNPGQELVSELIGAKVRFTAFYDGRNATISGVVFADHNGDGRQSTNEPGLPGVTVIDPGLHQYYIPFNYTNLRTMFQGTSSCAPGGVAGSTAAQTIISLVSSGDGTIFYFDHWEDGYDTDPTLPGSTTIVGLLNSGQSRIFQNQVNTAVLPAAPPVFDGRDRITVVGDPAAVTMSFWLNNPGTLLAGAWEVPEVANWGTNYVVPVGEDLGKDTNGLQGGVDYNVFDYVGLEVMAATPGTVVTVTNFTPAPSVTTVTLNPGQTFFVPGNANGNNANDNAQGIYSGATIDASAPVQVQVRTGQCNATYSGRSYTLVPTNRWSNNYWSPSPDWDTGICTTGDFGTPVNHFTDVYIRNPNSNAIRIDWQNSTGSNFFNVPPNSTVSFRNQIGFGAALSNSGLNISSPDGNFWAVAVADAYSPVGEGANFDWSYSLIPLSELTSQAVLGSSPGSFPAPGIPRAGDSGSLAYVTAVSDSTRVFVDLNQDGAPDYFDINGDGDTNDIDAFGFNETNSIGGILLNAGQTLRVADPNPTDTRNAPTYFGNSDLNGALIYTTDLSQHLAIAWGEDPCQALYRAPYLDLGYTVLPLPTPNIFKLAELAVDADLTGGVTPGDTISYTLVIHNNGQGSINNPTLVDILPFTYTNYIVDSLLASTPPNGVPGISYDTGSGFTTTPPGPPGTAVNVRRIQLRWTDLAPGGFITVTLALLTQLDIPPDVTELVNGVTLAGTNIPTVTAQAITPLSQPQLRIRKSVNTTTAAPGDTLTYTVVLSNVGNGVAVDTRLSDLLPPLVTYISNSLVLTYPQVVTVSSTVMATSTTYFNSGYADDFDNAGVSTDFTGSDGNLTWGNAWQPSSADVQVGAVPANANTTPAYLEFIDTDDLDDSAWRLANLTGFLAPSLYFYLNSNTTEITKALQVDISTNNGASWPQTFVITPTTPYAFYEVDLTPYAGVANFAVRLRGPATLDANEFLRVDNVAIVDTNQVRSGPLVPIIQTTSILTYSTSSNLDPVSLIGNTMLITEGLRLPPGGIITASYQVKVPIPLTDGLSLTNIAQVTASNLITIPFPLTDTAQVTIASDHTLQIQKTGVPSPTIPGGLITYTLVYTVQGNEPAPNVVITDAVPISTSFVSAGGGGAESGGVISWNLGNMLTATSGITLQTGVVTFAVQVDPAFTGSQIPNTAYISDSSGKRAQDDEIIPVVNGPILLLQKSAVDANGGLLGPGDTLTYTIVVANVGAANATGAVISDNLPPNTQFVPNSISIVPAGNGTLGTAPPTLVSGVTITAGQSVTVSFAVTIDAATPDGTNIVNTASVTSTEVPTPTTNTVTNTVGIVPLLHLDKRVSPTGQTAPGNILTYTLCYSNSGTAPATGVVLTDDIPINTSYVPGSVTTDTGSIEFNDGTTWTPVEPASVSSLRWLIGTLPNDSVTRCVNFQVAVNLTISATGGLAVQYSEEGWIVLAGDTSGLDVITYTEVTTSTPTPTPVLTTTPTSEVTATPEVTATSEITTTPEVTVTATPSPIPTATETPVITSTPTLIPTEEATPIQTTEPTSTVTAAPPTVESDTPTPVPTDTATTEPPPTDAPTAEPTVPPTTSPDKSAFAPAYPPSGWFTALSAVAFPALWDNSGLAIQAVITDVITTTSTVEATSELTLTTTPTPAATAEPTLPAPAPPTVETIAPASTPMTEAAVGGPYPIVPLSQVAVDIVNIATLGSNETTPITDTVTVPLLRIIDPVILKRADLNLAQPGDLVHFSIEVFQNPQANANATNIVVVDALPYLVDFVSANTSSTPPGVVVNTTVDQQLVPIVNHPNGITQTVASTVTMTIPVLGPDDRVVLELTTRVNNLANPAPQSIENLAILTFNEGSVPPARVTVNVPQPPSAPPSSDSGNNDDDDDNDNNAPVPPSPTNAPAVPAAVQPPSGVLPVAFLPETGLRGAGWEGGAVAGGLILLVLSGFALRFRRKK